MAGLDETTCYPPSNRLFKLVMSTRVVLIEAGPTPWDAEGRIVGSRPLPVTAEGIDAIRHLLDALAGRVNSVYRTAQNEACDQVAKLISQRFGLRLRDNKDLETVNLGLWEGLTPEEVRFRFPTVFPQWQEHPLAVTAPDGEPLPRAINRIGQALNRILRRNRNLTIALALRPMALQIAAGTLRRENHESIAAHLHESQPIATIEVV
jgi:broad specificity phosphatase PhoE